MPKISKKQVDVDEKKVIQELQHRTSDDIGEIAKRCGFSRQKVSRIIKKLEENKTIWGYHAVIDNEKLQLKKYVILFKKTSKPMHKEINTILSRAIEKQATELGVNISSSIYMHGFVDWMITFTATDIRQAKKFCDQINQIYGDFVGESFLVEEIFPVKSCGIENPDLKKIKDYF
jgi:DNA-binding Lrp family transcriptional regulator